MRTLGLIGGTSWVSTIDYYQLINRKINEKLGGLNSAKLILYSVNFEEFKPPPDLSEWDSIRRSFIGISQKLIGSGADCIILCANTPHLIADDLQKNITRPLIHIAEVTARKITGEGIKGIETIIPDARTRDYIHHSIFSELARGVFRQETKEKYIEVIYELKNKGVEAVVFACTEIPILIKPKESPLPYFDTTKIHAEAAVDFALYE